MNKTILVLLLALSLLFYGCVAAPSQPQEVTTGEKTVDAAQSSNGVPTAPNEDQPPPLPE